VISFIIRLSIEGGIMELLIIRHGESEADLLKVLEGRADFSLTQRGHLQAYGLGLWLKEHADFNVILSSSLKRAKETTAYISKAFKMKANYLDQLMEWDNGLLAGLSIEEANRRFPLKDGMRKPYDTSADTESLIAFRARAEHFVSKLLDDYPEDAKICIVSHGGMITMILRSLLKLPMDTKIGFGFSDTSICHVKISQGACQLLYVNRQEHLLDLSYKMVIEQRPQDEKRMVYDPQNKTFRPSPRLSLFYVRDVRCHYGWLHGFSHPPSHHLDVILVGEEEHALGALVDIKIIGVFIRRDQDHKLLAVKKSSQVKTLKDLNEDQKEKLYKLYPVLEKGEGWFERDRALEVIFQYINH
jgi:2,3-bisphosphoglycerate-dependent phosphoglycerate mutase